jgi:hypothetical protein
MKRFAFAVLLVMAVVAGVLLALNRPGAEASPDFTITVDSTDDTNTRDFDLTLREAMLLATGVLSLADLTQGECYRVSDTYWELFPPHCESMGKFEPGEASADTIVFYTGLFSPGDPATITLGCGGALPILNTGDDTVDGSAAGVIVEGGGTDMFTCFVITSDSNTIKGLGIKDCTFGVDIREGAQNNAVGGSGPGEGNVISGNRHGVEIRGDGTDHNSVKGNFIGTNAAGDTAVGNHFGVMISGDAQNNTIGGSTEAERNVISGNLSDGVRITGDGTDHNSIEGNYIGTNAAGDAALPNTSGVWIWYGSRNNTIGGSTEAERNVISGNARSGVDISGNGTDGNVVKGNYIGTDASGTDPIPNDRAGMLIWGGAQNNTIGGSTEAERNVISGNNEFGVEIEGDGTDHNRVEGNYIGINAAGDAPIPNGQHGVFIGDGAQSNTIGGTAAGKGNTIAFNNQAGVGVDGPDTSGNTIRGNFIHSNGDKGIESHMGGNEALPPPLITGFGSVMGTACLACVIDIYSDDEDEGRVYEGSTTANDDGNWTFSGTPEGPNVTATATDSDGNTSEFSEPLAVPEPTPSPTPSPTPGATRTLAWGPGWQNATWSGTSSPEEAFACAASNYAAAYRLVSGGWERYFPGRPDISNMTDLGQYDAFLILVTADVTCEMPVADPLGTEHTLDWGVGWQNEGWTGADGTAPQGAFACADGSYAAAYRLVGGGWERYFPDRPEISNMGPLNKYDAFLILVTAPVSCTMAIAP